MPPLAAETRFAHAAVLAVTHGCAAGAVVAAAAAASAAAGLGAAAGMHQIGGCRAAAVAAQAAGVETAAATGGTHPAVDIGVVDAGGGGAADGEQTCLPEAQALVVSDMPGHDQKPAACYATPRDVS